MVLVVAICAALRLALVIALSSGGASQAAGEGSTPVSSEPWRAVTYW